MEYLREEDLFPGSMVKIYLNGKFEGYASLIEQAGEKMTYIEDDSDENVYPIYGKCRWLIEWVRPEDSFFIDQSHLMTQKILAGKRTHRHVRYFVGIMSWETYARENGDLTDKGGSIISYKQKRLLDMKDKNFIF